MNKIYSGLIITAVLLGGAQNLLAGTQTTQFMATATLAESCIVSVGSGNVNNAINAGEYTGGSNTAPAATSTAATVACPDTVVYSIHLNTGLHSTNFQARRMRHSDGSNNFLNYNLYTTAGQDQVWGDGTAGTATIMQTGRGTTQDRLSMIHTRILANQEDNLPTGMYTDTVTLSLSF